MLNLALCVFFISEDFTEELLGLHDAEIQRLRQHYEDHKVLFEGVHQWEESWRLFQDLEVITLFQSFPEKCCSTRFTAMAEVGMSSDNTQGSALCAVSVLMFEHCC